jgi:hypothetical protein
LQNQITKSTSAFIRTNIRLCNCENTSLELW